MLSGYQGRAELERPVGGVVLQPKGDWLSAIERWDRRLCPSRLGLVTNTR
jgi:hypothetical protein